MNEAGLYPSSGSLSRSIPTTIREKEAFLLYPHAWQASVHPLASELQIKTAAWLRELGVVRNPEQEERLNKLDVARYAGWPFPQGKEERFEILMKFLTLWILYDDVIEERAESQPERIAATVAGQLQSLAGGSAHSRGFWELSQSYGKAMSPRWMDRHGRLFGEWLRSVPEEFAAATQVRENGLHPNAARHLQCRTVGAGMPVVVNLIEYAIERELPEELLQDPRMQSLWRLAGELVAIANDLYSFGKDLKQRWCNLISSLAQEFHVPLETAFEWGIAMHNARIHEFEFIEAGLLADSREPEVLVPWLQGLHHALYGLAKWHEMTHRYSYSQAPIGGQRMHLRVLEFGDRPAPKA